MTIKRGMTLGKFAPFHKGHQLVVETALKENDEVIVIIYDSPGVTSIPLSTRSEWIEKLYPQVRVIRAYDGPEEVGDTPEIQQMHEDYLLNRLDLPKIDRFYSSENYGNHVSIALGAENRIVDRQRETVPVSGTEIRNNPFLFKELVDPLVYRDLVGHAVFLGAPSTGKTTLAQMLAEKYDTCWMFEYGRFYWEEHQVNRRLTPLQLLEIAETHCRLTGEKLLDSKNWCFSDTGPFTTFMFSLYYHGYAPEELEIMAMESFKNYDLVFLCETDIPYEDSWDRSGDVLRKEFQEKIRAELVRRGVLFHSVKGDIQERVQFVSDIVDNFNKK